MSPEITARLCVLHDPDALDPRERDSLVRQHALPAAAAAARKWYSPNPDQGHQDEYDDLVQVGVLAIIQGSSTWDPERGPFRPWARRCAYNAIVRHLPRLRAPVKVPERVRRQGPGTTTGVELPDEENRDPDPRLCVESPLEESESTHLDGLRTWLDQALASGILTAKQRKAFTLYGRGWPVSEIQERMGYSSHSAVVGLIQRGVHRLREAYENEDAAVAA